MQASQADYYHAEFMKTQSELNQYKASLKKAEANATKPKEGTADDKEVDKSKKKKRKKN